MASKQVGCLANYQRVRLAASIGRNQMESVALGYLGLDEETIDNLDAENTGNPEKFNRALIKRWEWKNTGRNASKELAAILFRAASEQSYVNPEKIHEILGISQQEAEGLSGSGEDTFNEAVVELVALIKAKSRAMCKSEMAPWSHDVTTNMADLDFHLKSRQNRNKLFGYKQLFQVYDKKSRGQPPKVLITGCHGSGKTLLSKKIVHDWAKGEFKQFPIVFVLFLEELGSVRSLEQAIVDQYNLTDTYKETLKGYLKTEAGKCLFILDGADSRFFQECPLMQSNVLVTSNLTSEELAQKYFFHEHLEIPSLSRADALNVHKDKNKIETVLSSLSDSQCPLTPSGGYNPMLGMFMSVLESREPGSSVSTRNVCDIYLQLVSSLCKLSIKDMCSQMKSVGRVVFDHLQGRKKLPDTGPEIDFLRENGLVIPGASGKFVFTHGTLGLFIGALYFTLELSEGVQLNYLVAAGSNCPVFLSSKLFLYFCLSLLKQTELPGVDREKGYKELKRFVVKKLDFVQIDLRDICEIYPVLKCTADSGDITVQFLSDVLVECSHAKVLFVNHKLPVIRILKGMGPSVFKLNSLICVNPGELLESKVKNDTELHVVVQNQACDFQNELLEFLKKSGEKFSLEFIAGDLTPPMMELSEFTQSKITQLHIKSSRRCSFKFFLRVGSELEVCSSLTHLTLASSKLEFEPFQALGEATEKGKLPELSSLCLRGQGSKLKGKLPLLFKTPWPKLTDLDLSSGDKYDIQHKNDMDHRDLGAIFGQSLPNLSRLRMSDICFRKLEKTGLKTLEVECSQFFKASVIDGGKFPDLTTLKLLGKNLNQNRLTSLGSKLSLETFAMHFPSSSDLNILVNEPFLRRLVHLDLSGTPIEGKEFLLFRDPFPKLENLNLGGCGMNEEGMRILAQANQRGNLPMLRHLDLSQRSPFSPNDNQILYHSRRDSFSNDSYLKLLASFDSKWSGLTSLGLSLLFDSGIHDVVDLVKTGCMDSLEMLAIDCVEQDTRWLEWEISPLINETGKCRNTGTILESVMENLEVFSVLKHLKIYTSGTSIHQGAELRQRIRSHNISLHLVHQEDE